MGQEDVLSALQLMMISDENKDQFYQFFIFLIVFYLIDPDIIKLYQKENLWNFD